MEDNHKSKETKNSYIYKANERIDGIEIQIKAILESLTWYGKRIDSNPEIKILVRNYLIWANKCLETQKELIEMKQIAIAKKYDKSLFYSKEKEFYKNFNKGLNKYHKQIQQFRLNRLKNKLLFSDPEVDSVLCPLISGMKPSELFLCFSTLYAARLDPDALWLSRTNFELVIRSTEPSLLKSILLESLVNLADFPDELYQFITNQNKYLDKMVIDSYNEPSIENVIAICMLLGEQIFHGKFLSSNFYLGQAIRMAETLDIIPKENNFNTFTLTSDNSIKQKLWEMLLFYQVLLYTVGDCPTMLRDIRVVPLFHIKNKTLCLPSLARHSSKKILSNTCKQILGDWYNNTTDGISLCRFEDLEYHSRSLSYYLQLSQFYLNGRNILRSNTNLEPIDRFYFEKEKLVSMINEIDNELNATPEEYKKYRFLSFKQFYEVNNFGLLLSDSNNSLGSLGYLMLLSSKLFLIDPISFLCRQPHNLLHPFLWKIAFEAADALWDFLSSVFNKQKTESECVWVVVNNTTDLIPLVTFYLNALSVFPLSDLKSKEIIFKLDTVFNWLKNHDAQTISFPDSNFTLPFISDIIKEFNLENLFSI